LDILYTALGSTLSNTGVTVPIPNDFAWYVKWGTMADMLKIQGQANDPIRAEYCEMRFQEGIELAKEIMLG